MDQTLKERLLGAVVIITLAVIFVPMILRGQQEGAAKSAEQILPLPAQSLPPNVHIINVEQETVPSNNSTNTVQSLPPRELVPAKPKVSAPAVDVVEKSASSVVKPDVYWAVQVGSFAQQDNAKRLAQTLQKKDYQAFVVRALQNGEPLYRVRVGPLKTEAKAHDLAKRLKHDGQTIAIVKHP